MASNRRLTMELTDLGKTPVDNVDVAPEGDNLYKWKAMLSGLDGTPYENGLFEIDINFPTEYPFKAPEVRFVTRIYHPNIKTDTGEICADVIRNGWAPTLNVRYVLNTIKQLLEEPNPDSPLEAAIAEQFKNNREAYVESAKQCTAEFAAV